MKRAEAPTYREGRPRVDLIKAAAERKRDRIVCRFFDEDNNEVGEAFFFYWGSGEVELGYHFPGDWRAPDTGLAQIQTLFADEPTSSNVLREFFQCPQCGKRVATLAYKSSWACSRCHRLLSRCQVVPKAVRTLERLTTINERIGSRRPTGMHEVTFQTLKAERRVLKKELGGVFVLPSVSHFKVIRAEWMTLEKAGTLGHPWFEIRGEEIVFRSENPIPEEVQSPEEVRHEPASAAKPQPKPIRFDPSFFDIPGDPDEFDD